MAVTMVQVGIVRVPVAHRGVMMPVRMWLSHRSVVIVLFAAPFCGFPFCRRVDGRHGHGRHYLRDRRPLRERLFILLSPENQRNGANMLRNHDGSAGNEPPKIAEKTIERKTDISDQRNRQRRARRGSCGCDRVRPHLHLQPGPAASLERGFPPTPYDRAAFYGGEEIGYTDYPFHETVRLRLNEGSRFRFNGQPARRAQRW